MKKSIKWIIVLTLGMAAGVSAAITPPSWVNDSGVISVTYRFETPDNEPAPSESTNLVSTPYMLVDKVTLASAGWMDLPNLIPDDPHMNRENGGVWELGETGYMDLLLPLIQTPEPEMFAEFYIEVIAGTGLHSMPVVTVDNAIGFSSAQEVIEFDPLGQWDWSQQVSTGTVSLVSATGLSFRATCPDATSYGDSSAIDQVVVYTRVIPEPTSLTLIGMSVLLALLGRRFWYA